MATASFRGVFPYLVSPVTETGEVKSDVLTRLCDDLIAAGVHGLTPLGSTGEFAYLKDASFNTGRLLSIINCVVGRLQVFAASAHIPACVMLIGGAGWMAGPACLIPRQSVELYELCRRGDWERAMELQRDLWAFNQAFAKYNLAACIKGGLELQGYDVGPPLPPQAPLSPEGTEEIRQALMKVGALQNATTSRQSAVAHPSP